MDDETNTQNNNNIFVNSPRRTKMRALRHAESTYTHNKYAEIYTHTHTHTHRHTHTHKHTHTHTPKPNDTFLKGTKQKKRTRINTYLQIDIHTNIHTYIHTYIHAYMHACMHTYIHTCNQTKNKHTSTLLVTR